MHMHMQKGQSVWHWDFVENEHVREYPTVHFSIQKGLAGGPRDIRLSLGLQRFHMFSSEINDYESFDLHMFEKVYVLDMLYVFQSGSPSQTTRRI